MTRICIITSIHPDYDARVYKHCLAMCDRGLDVTFISPWPGEHMDPRIRHLQFPRTPGIRGRFVNMRHIWRLASQAGCDLYHFHDLDISPLMALFKIVSGRPVVYDVHENYSLEMLEKPSVPAVLRWPLYWTTQAVQKVCCSIIHNVVPVVRSIVQDLHQPGMNTLLIRNFASKQICEKAQDDFRTRPPALLFLACQYVSNGSLLFMDIVEKIAEKYPDVRFYTIDRFPRLEDLKEVMLDRASKGPQAGRVEFLPLIPVSEVPSYINKATVGLYLGLNVAKQVRALPTKLFEYMGCGVPIVASDLPYCRQFVEQVDSGLLARPGDADDFVEKISRLLDDRQYAFRLGQNGRKAIYSRLNWETEMDRLVAWYEKILADYRAWA